MRAGELRDGHRPASGELFDVVVCSGHVAMLVIVHGTTEMLNDVRRNAHRFQRPAIFVDRKVLENDLATERLGEFDRHLLMVHLDRTGDWNSLADMSVRIFQKRRDGAALIVRSDRRMTALADRHPEHPLLQIGQLPRIEQPFEKIGRTQMNDG